ncbi:probable diacetyl reductase [(R)-acetoin forming] 2 [Aspergillus lentulus]|nr:probable diacetyl reductase [(R)-acetoin forming] 2 [Aspergillus lentulus]
MLNTTIDSVNTLRTRLKTTPTMKSVRFHGPGDIRIEEIDEPTCGKGQVKLRPAFVGICGSDLHEYRAGPVLIPKEPHKITGTSYPVTLGHEFAGVIEEVGEGVTHLSPGQRAVHTVAPAEHFPLPDDVSLEAAALIEPLAVAWHAVNLSPFKGGNNVMVVGGGPIGIGIVQILKLQGAKKIMVAELLDNRKRFALEYGATEIIDPRTCDVPEKVRELTNGVGADAIFDTAGVEVALNGAISACRVHGTIVNIAVWEKRPSIRVNELMYHEVNYTGAALYDESAFRNVIQALNYGQLKPEGMITAKVTMDEVVEKGFKTLLEDRGEHCKILVDVQAS